MAGERSPVGGARGAVAVAADAEARRRRTAVLRHRLRLVARRIVDDCHALLSDSAQREWRTWREAVGAALLAGHELRTLVDRRLHSAAAVLSPDEMAALLADLRKPQRRIVEAMTRVLGLVPTGLEDELLIGDARAIRELALRFGDDDVGGAPAETEQVPVARASPGPVELSSAPSPTSGIGGAVPAVPAQACILVVDDSDAPRQMLARLLERLDYEILTASDGLDALAILGGRRVDLVLSDIEMPQCDGFALLKRLKADDALHDIPVIMVSGLGDTRSVVRCLELGADDHVTKPFDSVILQARVRASLEQKRLRDGELHYLRRVAGLTVAAQAVEDESYESGTLAHIAETDDELGRLARVFDRLVLGMRAKEAQLQRRLTELRREVRGSSEERPATARPDGDTDATTLAIHLVLANRYEILGELGRGGMGRVYRARDRELDVEVAVKVVRQDVLNDDASLVERLRTESRLARRITHPNVVRVYDYGDDGGVHFLTMELVRGITLERLLESRGRLAAASTLAIGQQLAEALAVAHAQEVIHRDIKPANLLVDVDGVLKVMDFGLARPVEVGQRLTAHGMVIGTPRYMAPEQLLDGDVDARSDLFAMGAVLYECLTGLPPFEAASPASMVQRMVHGSATPIATLVTGVAPTFAALVEQLVRYEPADRIQTATEVSARLRGIA